MVLTNDERTRPWQEAKPLRWKEGDLNVTRSNAWSGPGCHEGCGVLLYTDQDGQLVKVEGDPENPFNQGRLCVRCLDLQEVVDHPDRLRYPMKRVGARGEDKWERISWDEAYDTIEAEFNKIKKDYGAESVIFCQGTGRDILSYVSRLAYSFGSPNWACLGLTGNACYLPRVAAGAAVAGGFAVTDASQYLPERYNDPRYTVPECLVLWGNNPIVSNSDGFFGHWVVDLMKRGTKLIVIDPRVTWLASHAEYHLQIRPGTDAALALGMLNVIIQEKLYDADFVDRWTYGFDQLAERAAQYPVKRVSEITWIPEEKIVAAARAFATAKPAAIQWGLAIDMTKESLPAAHAIQALWSITGNVNIPGGMINTFAPFDVVSWLGAWGYDDMTEEQKSKRLGVKEYPILNFGFMIAQSDIVTDALCTGKPYPIKGAWIQTSNPIANMATDPKRLYDGLKSLDFVVVVDLFKTPTAVAFADIILPAATYAERNGIRALWYHVGAITKAVEPDGEIKSDQQIVLELGKRFNPRWWPWRDDKEMFSAMIEQTGMTFEGLQGIGGQVYPAYEYRTHETGRSRADGEPGFNTNTGRIELYSTLYEMWGLDPLPYFEEPTESPTSTPDIYKEYPLVLTTGARQWGSFHSEHRQVPRLRALHPDPELQIHPETAARYGIRDGEWVWIENSMGRCKQRARVTPVMDPRVVNADHGWWFPEKQAEEPSLFGVWESNINLLVPSICGRSGFGGNYKSLLCKIYRVQEGEV